MADVQDGSPLGGKPPDGGKQDIDLLRRQHRGGLVHDQQLRVLQQAADDFHPLTLADGKGVHQPAGVEAEAVPVRHGADAFGQPGYPPRPVDTERDVLGNGQAAEQREMLEHHADTEASSDGRTGYLDGRALPQDFARIGVQHAVYDLDERALAGAVLPQQGVNLAGQKG